MRKIIAQPKDLIASFVAKHIGLAEGWRDYSTLALIDDSRILVGVVYNRWCKHDVCMHVAVQGRIIPEMLFAAFDYPFNQVKVARITGLVPARNLAAQRFDEHLGFVREGLIRRGVGDDDLIVYGMLKEECKWISSAFCERLDKRSTLHARDTSQALV